MDRQDALDRYLLLRRMQSPGAEIWLARIVLPSAGHPLKT